uniref:NfeD family protein n=1 Tax=Acetatifactor sp. TaxID=1872090 RepID=UPI004056501A
MSGMMIFWLVILILAIGIEVATLGLASIWFAPGALAAIIATALNAPLVVQIILFFAVSLLLLYFTRPIAVKYFNKDRIKTNVESLVGKQAIVISEIDNLQGIGQVVVNGQEWTARTVKEGIKLPVGTVVNIMAISGVKLMVEEDAQMERVNGGQKATEQAVSIEPEKE